MTSTDNREPAEEDQSASSVAVAGDPAAETAAAIAAGGATSPELLADSLGDYARLRKSRGEGHGFVRFVFKTWVMPIAYQVGYGRGRWLSWRRGLQIPEGDARAVREYLQG